MSKVKFITFSNLVLPSIEGLTRKHIHPLHSDEVFKKTFANNTFSVIYKRNKNLKEIASTSLYQKPSIKGNGTIVSCSKCDS